MSIQGERAKALSGRLRLRVVAPMNLDAWLLALTFALAAFSRLYALNSFPFFPPESPWLGIDTSHPGLYLDEAGYLNAALSFPMRLSAYQPWLQIAAVKLSTLLMGASDAAARLPSALSSSIIAPLLYLLGKELFASRGAALLSSFYYIAMVPALVYGRMLFLENFAALFSTLTLLFMVRHLRAKRERDLYLASLFAALAALSKVNGIIAPAFLSLALLLERPPAIRLRPLLLAWSPAIAFVIAASMIRGSLSEALRAWWVGYVGRELSWQYLFIQSMPSGYILFSGGYVKPELWYLYAYACLAALLLKQRREALMLLYPLAAFAAITIGVWGLGSYYAILIFPFLALAAGGGTSLLLRLPDPHGLGLYTSLYVALVASVVASLSLPIIDFNYALFVIKLLLLLLPLAIWMVARLLRPLKGLNPRLSLAACTVGCFFVLLIVATPYLYPYYFLGRA